MMSDPENEGLQDAVRAFGTALAAKDWAEATQAFEDMWRLVDDDEDEGDSAETDGEKRMGKPLAALIIGKK